MSKPKTAKNIEVPLEALKGLLTPSELRMIRNRFQIVNLLEDGLSIRAIAAQVKVGTDTVVRVARMVEKGAFMQVKKAASKERKFKTKTPWIFGSGK